MTYVFLDEQNQTYRYPEINKDNISNYNKSVELLESDGAINVDPALLILLDAGKALIRDKQVIDISDTDEYKTKIAEIEKATEKTALLDQINKLDIKRIRAGFESSVKDESTGETYLEYYTKQIIDLREKISSL